jgi:hypothetical protein
MPDSPDIPTVVPTLHYANYGTDGLPPYVAEAEALIDLRSPPKAIRKHFRDSDHAVRYFARSMQYRFALAKLGHTCASCGVHNCATITAADWRVEFPRKLMEWKVSGRACVAVFRTHHVLCTRCHADWIRRCRRRVLGQWIGLPLMGIAGGALGYWKEAVYKTLFKSTGWLAFTMPTILLFGAGFVDNHD